MSSDAMSVVLETRGGRRAGVGHLIRSRALAACLRRRRAHVVLLSTPAGRAPRAPDVVVVDRPDTSAAGLLGCHRRWPAARLVALDYYGPPVAGLEAVVNLNEARERGWARPRVYRHGLRYATLRESFPRLRRERRYVPVRVRRITVGFGGTDPDRWSWLAVRAIRPVLPRDVRIDLLLGRASAGSGARHDPSHADGFVRVRTAVEDPASLLQASDLLIIGGGPMMIEAACLGVPAVVVPRTVEERLFARQFVRAGAVRPALPRASRFPASAVQRQVAALFADQPVRRRMGREGRRLVDGRGMERVARLILQVGGRAA